jgi:hypothetical protein
VPKPNIRYKVGDRVKVSLQNGLLVDATVRAIVEKTDGVRLQVDYGKDETALVQLCQCIRRNYFSVRKLGTP